MLARRWRRLPAASAAASADLSRQPRPGQPRAVAAAVHGTGRRARREPHRTSHPRPYPARRALPRRRRLVRFRYAMRRLAQPVPTVLFSEVPVFSAPEHDDAARRFIALVDEFYDQGTKLVLSAAAAPSELYRLGRLQLEFQRTASRLVEMQTRAYLARARRG